MSRRARVKVTFRGIDISKYIESFTYSDNTDFTDDISLTISDRDRFWSNKFFPETGDVITASIYVKNWNKENDERIISFGSFEVDNINYNVTKLTLNAVAIPIFSKIRDEKNYKTWEKVKLSVIAGDIAKKGNLKLVYDSKINPKYDKEEQQNETDLAYLENLCKSEGLDIKITGNQLVIFDEAKYDAQPSYITIENGKSFLYGYPSFKRNAKRID